MNEQASFEVFVNPEDAIAFATLSGDWNPLHTDASHAARTAYRRPVLHGAYSAGLMSRMAGMHLPGTDCLLHSLRLRFIKPIIPPAALVVAGRVISDSGTLGRVEVTVSDSESGTRYVDGSYDFGRHENTVTPHEISHPELVSATQDAEPILVTGANGGIGRSVMQRLGTRAIGIARGSHPGLLLVPNLELIGDVLGSQKISGIVHCAWPSPDNQRITALTDIDSAVEHNVAAPLRQVLSLARLLDERGTADAALILIGSNFANPGRHNYRMPLYTLSKALVSPLARILALELAPSTRRCIALTFDVIEGGMNKQLSPAIRAMHADRVPSGRLPSLGEVAEQITWILENRSFLVSGATIDLTGAAIP